LCVGSSSQRARPSSLTCHFSPGTREPPFICSQGPRTG
jgi:hypothetical protein